MRQIDQKLQLLLQTWAEPCKHLLFLYKQSRDTWALSCGIYGNHTERSKQVVFLTLTCTRHHVLILRWDSEHVTVRCRYKHQCSYWLQFTSIFVYISSLRRRVSSALQPLIVGSSCLDDGWRRLRVLSPKGQPAPEPFNEPPHVHDIKVDIVSEIGADVGVSVQQGAVERSPTHTDHHSNEAQQQQDQAGVSAHLICKTGTNAVSDPPSSPSSNMKHFKFLFYLKQTAAAEEALTVPCSLPSSGSLNRTLRLEVCLLVVLLGGGNPSSDALLLFRMETRPSGDEFWRRHRDRT